MDELVTFALAVLPGVVVSLVTVRLAGRQRANEEARAEERRREAILAAIGTESIKPVFEHYVLGGKAREGIRALPPPPGDDADERVRGQWIEVCNGANVDVSTSATQALPEPGPSAGALSTVDLPDLLGGGSDRVVSASH